MPSPLSPRLRIWFAIATIFLVGSFAVRYATFSRLTRTTHDAASTRELLRELESLLSALKDAESGQRGYLITGDRRYLEPYERARKALGADAQYLGRLVADDREQQARLSQLQSVIQQKLAELDQTITLRERDGFEAAKAVVDADRGRGLMREASAIVDTMIAGEEHRLDYEQQQVQSAERANMVNFFALGALNLLLLGVLFNVVRVEALQRAAAADTIQQHELRLRRVVESNVIGILLFDGRGQIIDANDAFLQLVGYDRSDLAAGRIDRDGVTVPEFRRRDQQALEEVRRAGKCTPYEKEFSRRDGSRFPALVGIARIDDAGLQFVAFVLDLSQRLQAEEARARLASIVESSDDEVISTTLDGTIVTWNAGAARLFGYTAEEVVGQPNSVLVPPDRREEQQRVLERLRREEQTEHLETVRITKSGKRIHMALTLSLIRDESGRIIGISKIGRDITARKQAEQERERLLAAEQAARAESDRIGRVKDEFLATLSHELRTPLNAILGWTHLLGTGDMDPAEVTQGLEIIGRSARAQTQLIDDLLDMSRIVSGKLRMDVQQVRLSGVIAAAIEAVRPAAEARQITIQTVLDPNAGPVRGDPNRLQQVVWNLLANAVKFTPKGGRVQVALATVNSHVEITVSDTGQGIDPEFLPHVFERFRQADASTTRRHSGLGLGLAIVRHLVESHGGAVSVASPGKGQGSTFVVSLPLVIMHQVDDGADRVHPRSESAVGGEGPAAPDLSGVKVLVVDDEADSRQLVKRLLEDQHATVLTAASTAEALATIREQMPTVLLSDIGMPEADGYTLIHQLRALPAAEGGSLPAAALTAFARSEDRRRALASGFQMHLAKPIEPAELLAAVANLAERGGGGAG